MQCCASVVRARNCSARCVNTRRTAVLAAVAACSLAVPAFGQGSGSLTIEASRDGGTTWERGTIDIGGRYDPLRIRFRSDWADNIGFAFAGAHFDVVISNAGPGDVAFDPVRPGTFASGSSQTLVASRFGSTIKIDDSRDTAPPGAGGRGVFPGQLAQAFAGTNFTVGRPVTIFEFSFTPDASFNSRLIDVLYVLPSGGPQPPIPNTRIYTSSGGAQRSIVAVTNTLNIIDTPTPGVSGILGLSAIVLTRRRRAFAQS